MMNILFFMCRNIERMVPLVQRKSPAHQHKSIYHYALIKIIVMHQLAQQGITWEDFISRDYFAALQPPPEIVHDEGAPSHQPGIPETEHISAPPYVTYQRGHRTLFASTRRVLSSPGVEGVSLTSSAQRVLSPPRVEGASFLTAAPQVQDKGKKPKHEEKPSGEPSGFVIIHDDETASESEEAQYIRIIKEQETDIQALQIQLEMAKSNIRYLEQRNKQLEDQHAIIELQNIRENRQAAQHREIEFTSLEQQVNEDREANLERVNIYLEERLKKANRDNALLKHMAMHYKTRNLVCKARIRSLKAKLKKAVKRQKRQKKLDRLRILAEASLAEHST